MTDFVQLSRAARLSPTVDTHDRLWTAMFALPAWHFIRTPSPSGWLPFAGFINGLRCVLGFTEAARADGYARFAALMLPGVASPVLSMTSDETVELAPRLRTWGIAGLVFDTGPDGFYTPLDQLAPMKMRYGSGTPARVAAPAPVAPVALAAVAVTSPRGLTVDAMLALPAWHVVTTVADPSFPDLTFHDTELVAQVYSSAHALARRLKPGNRPPPTAVMAPATVLSLLSDIELVGIVRFDGELDVTFVDLQLRAARVD